MSFLGRTVLRIKRRETPFFDKMYRLACGILHFSVPSVRLIHLPLYHFDRAAKRGFRQLVNSFWSVPVFKARCEKCGKNLSLPNGIPFVIGEHLKIYLGDNVTIGRSTIGAAKVFDEPVLRIGNNTTINYGTIISVAKQVIIGNDCMISVNCLIMDSDDHPISPKKRLLRLPVEKESVKPVRIGNNVWIGAYSAILKGVKIGNNSIIAAHSVVTEDIPANNIYAGIPARCINKDINNLDLWSLD